MSSEVKAKIRVSFDGGEATRGLSQLAGKFEQFNAGITRLAVGFAGLQVGRGTLDLIDTFNGLTARLKATTGSQLLYNQALDAARNLSTQYQASLSNTAKLIDRVFASIQPLGGTVQNAATATEALLAALKISGATADETSSAILQFSQALGKGVLNGDEFNSINEAAPGLLRALGDALDKSTADLKKMGEQGTLTSDVIIKAATIALPALQKQAAAIGPTISGSFTTLNNALTEFVGKAGQANGTARIVAGGMKLLADNIGLVVNALSVLAGGALLAGVVRLGAALPTIAGAVTGVGLALRGVTAFLSGPVGLIAVLGSLALAWGGVGVAQRAGTDRTIERVKQERQRVQEIVDNLNGKNAADKQSGQSTATAGRQAALDRNVETLRQLDAELSKLEAKAAATGGGDVDIRADGVLKAKLEENKGRRKLDEEYARDRALIETQSAKTIAALRQAGRNKDADDLKIDTAQSLERLKKSHDDAIRSLTKDETNTRVAQYIEAYDRIGELIADGTARELKSVQSGFDNQLLSTRAYFAKRGDLEDAARRETISKIDSEIAARQAVLDRNRKLPTTSVDGAAELAEANKREVEAINKLEIERIKAQRELNDLARDRAIEEGKATRELAKQREEFDYQIKSANGLLTIADERRRLENQYADARRREFAETGDSRQTDELIQAQLRVTELSRLQAKFADLQQALTIGEEALDSQVDAGALSTEQAEKRKFDARQAGLPQLKELLDIMQTLAATDAEKNRVAELVNVYEKLKNQKTLAEKAFRDNVAGGLGQVFKDIVTGSESAAGAVKKFVSSIATSMLDVISKRLGESLLQSLLPSGGGLASTIGSFFGLYHSGGIAGDAAPMSRRLDPSIFAFAMRYHSGGIAGLRANEVPAILQAGEEVLTADDPRHRKNYSGASGTNVTIGVTVNGAQGSTDAQAGAARSLGSTLEAAVQQVVDRWAAREQRSGGILARGRA